MSRGFEDQLRGDGDRVAQRAVHRTSIGEKAVYAFGRLPLPFLRLEPQLDMDATDHQNAVFFFDFAYGFADQPVYRRGDLTRLQRASKGSGESTGGGGDDVIERGGVRRKGFGRHFVVLGDGAVNAKDHRRRFRGQVCASHRASFALDADFRAIDNVSHSATIAPWAKACGTCSVRVARRC